MKNMKNINEAFSQEEIDKRNRQAGFSDNMQRLVNALQQNLKQKREANTQSNQSKGGSDSGSIFDNLTPEEQKAYQERMDKIREGLKNKRTKREEDDKNPVSARSMQRGMSSFINQEDMRDPKDVTKLLQKEGQSTEDFDVDDKYDDNWLAKVSAFREALREVETGKGGFNRSRSNGSGSPMGRRLDAIAELSRPAVDWHGMLKRMFDSPTRYVERVKHTKKQVYNAVSYDKGLGHKYKEVWNEKNTEVEQLFILIDNTGSFTDAVAPMLSEIYTIAATHFVKKVNFAYFTDVPVRPEHVRSWTKGDSLDDVKKKLKRKETDLTGGTDVFLCAESLKFLPKELFDPKKAKLIILSDFETTPASPEFMENNPYIKNAWYVIVTNFENTSNDIARDLIDWGVAPKHCFPFTFRQIKDNILDNEKWDTITKTLG